MIKQNSGRQGKMIGAEERRRAVEIREMNAWIDRNDSSVCVPAAWPAVTSGARRDGPCCVAPVAGLGGIAAFYAGAGRARAQASPVAGDVPIDSTTAMIFTKEAPLVPAEGLRDARAVWCHVPAAPDKSVLGLFPRAQWLCHRGCHRDGRACRTGRLVMKRPKPAPWQRGGAFGLSARSSGIAQNLEKADRTRARDQHAFDQLVLGDGARRPVCRRRRLGLLVADCLTHLHNLHRADGARYLSDDFVKGVAPTGPRHPGKLALDRIYVGGHSGAGLPLEEVAKSAILRPDTGVPTDLWLFDSTYWSKVEGFVQFCKGWHQAGRLAGGRRDAARFVCIYRPGTSTEEVADDLRGQIARAIGVDPATLVKHYSAENLDKEIRPALARAGVLFLKTDLAHDEIPTAIIPLLLESAANPR